LKGNQGNTLEKKYSHIVWDLVKKLAKNSYY